jgi:hypothetical protein
MDFSPHYVYYMYVPTSRYVVGIPTLESSLSVADGRGLTSSWVFALTSAIGFLHASAHHHAFAPAKKHNHDENGR